MPNIGQISLLLLAAGLFAAAAGAASTRVAAKHRNLSGLLSWIAIALSVASLMWHSISRGSWVPLEDNFDALVWIGLLLAAFVKYVQRRRPVPGLEWFLFPLVAVLLVAAVIFDSTTPHLYVRTAWSWVHRISSYGAALGLFVAGAGGAMYLIAVHRLRDRRIFSASPLGSLERLEHLTFFSVTVGFALLTIALATGLEPLVRGKSSAQGWLGPKVLLGAMLWIVYAIVLHAPIAPALRGRKVAMLSVAGFVLLTGTLVASQFISGGTR